MSQTEVGDFSDKSSGIDPGARVPWAEIIFERLETFLVRQPLRSRQCRLGGSFREIRIYVHVSESLTALNQRSIRGHPRR